MRPAAAKSPYAGYRFPAEVTSQAVWLYFRFPLSLRMAEEMLAARGIVISQGTVRQWALKFGQEFASRIRRLLRAADTEHRTARTRGFGMWADVSRECRYGLKSALASPSAGQLGQLRPTV
jgi:putative transposase